MIPLINSSRIRGGFTLAEIVIALGICSLGLTAVLGVLSVALQMANNSSWETRSQLTAKRVIEDFHMFPENSATSTEDTSLRILGDFHPENPDFGPLLLSIDGDLRPLAFDTGSNPSSLHASAYQTGYDKGWALVMIRGEADETRVGVSKVTVSVESPAIAPEASRRKKTFVCLVPMPTSSLP